MVELIVVMVIIGVLGAVGAARYFDRTVYETASYAEQVRALIRYGQKVAVAQNRPVYVRLDGLSVALCFSNPAGGSCSAADRVLAASGSNSGSTATVARCDGSPSWACEGGPEGIAYTAAPATTVFSYDALGKPVAAPTFARLVLSFGAASGAPTVTIEQETGYVR